MVNTKALRKKILDRRIYGDQPKVSKSLEIADSIIGPTNARSMNVHEESSKCDMPHVDSTKKVVDAHGGLDLLTNRAKRSLHKMVVGDEQHEVTQDNIGLSGLQNQTIYVEDTSVAQQTTAQSQGEIQQVKRTTVQSQGETQQVKRNKRGPSQLKKLKEVIAPIEVNFNEMGQSLSVTLSSFLGHLVRETVPYTIADWRNVSDDMKGVLWKDIQQRFKLDQEWQKDYIFKEMGGLWRASKSRLVKQIRNAPNEAERLKLKPDNIPNIQQWKKFVKEKMAADSMAKSQKFRDIRKKQIPHTCSRRGLARLREDLKKKSDNPSSVGRKEVWTAAHLKKNGEPICEFVAKTLEDLEEVSLHTSETNIKEDAISKVLGPENRGRLRGIGGGVCYTKYSILTQREYTIAQLKEEQNHLKVQMEDMQKIMSDLMKKQSQEELSQQVSNTKLPSSSSVNTSMPNKCKLLDWSGTGEEVAQGRWSSSDPKILVHHIPLGPNAVRVWVDIAKKPEAFLWRPTSDMTYIEECVGTTVAWPSDKVIME